MVDEDEDDFFENLLADEFEKDEPKTPAAQPSTVSSPVTSAPSVATTQPAASTPTLAPTQTANVNVPQFSTPEVVIEDTNTFLAELGLEEDEVFAALMNDDDDDLEGTPIGALFAKDKEKAKVESDSFGPALPQSALEEEPVQKGKELAYVDAIPTTEREVPRYTDSPTSEWVPEEVYNAKIIPGMKTYGEEMSAYSKDKNFLYEDEVALLSDDTDEAIAMEIAKEMIAEEERKNAQLALENWDKLAYNDVADASNPLFSYLSTDVLEEIQNTSIVDKIREQEKMSPAERLAQQKKESLLTKMEEVLEKEKKGKYKPAPRVAKPVVEEKALEDLKENEIIAQVAVKEENPVSNVSNVIEETDSNQIEDTEKKGSAKWPYAAGGAGLFGLFIIFLIVFWKRDDDDDEDENKDSLEKQGVNV